MIDTKDFMKKAMLANTFRVAFLPKTVWLKNIQNLCDSHDELERKLKIAEDALARIRDKTEDNLIAAIADNILNPKVAVFSDDEKSLKQIRGDE